jgi:hypothetical protein
MSEIPKRGRGRPKSSKSFRLVAVPHAKPEYRKIGAALLALAILDRPGSDGGSQSMEDESHGSTQEVPRRAA